MKKDMWIYLDEILQKIGKSAVFLKSNPKQFIGESATYLSSILSPLFEGRSRPLTPEALRARIKGEVKKNLTGRFQDEALVNAVTDSLVAVAKEDPYYSYLLDVEEHVA